jgi:hypothetical protein
VPSASRRPLACFHDLPASPYDACDKQPGRVNPLSLVRKTAALAQAAPLAESPEEFATLRRLLDRASDPPPGNTVMWRGLSRLTDIALGAVLGAEIVGNWKPATTTA